MPTRSHSLWHFAYPHLAILVGSVVASVGLLRFYNFQPLIQQLSHFALPAAFLGGFLFNYSLTFVWGTSLLYLLAGSYSIWALWLCATLGGVVGNVVILQFIESDGLHHELRHLFSSIAHQKALWQHRPVHPRILAYHKQHRLKIKVTYWHFLLSILGALIIISPLPDELGVGLLGWANLSKRKFVVLSFILNGLGIGAIIGAGRLR